MPKTETWSPKIVTSALSHLLQSRPRRLLIVATANIRNDELIALVDQHLEAIVAALSEARFVELGVDQLIVHDDH
jgi:predicted nuclease of predicted toxin-antitoxin system